ncbi:MAG: hypothetical protein SFX73_06955 [Kofleriaceae bacterium]|nr:hypothetical protein [Kofleriaceae bacterium]
MTRNVRGDVLASALLLAACGETNHPLGTDPVDAVDARAPSPADAVEPFGTVTVRVIGEHGAPLEHVPVAFYNASRALEAVELTDVHGIARHDVHPGAIITAGYQTRVSRGSLVTYFGVDPGEEITVGDLWGDAPPIAASTDRITLNLPASPFAQTSWTVSPGGPNTVSGVKQTYDAQRETLLELGGNAVRPLIAYLWSRSSGETLAWSYAEGSVAGTPQVSFPSWRVEFSNFLVDVHNSLPQNVSTGWSQLWPVIGDRAYAISRDATYASPRAGETVRMEPRYPDGAADLVAYSVQLAFHGWSGHGTRLSVEGIGQVPLAPLKLDLADDLPPVMDGCSLVFDAGEATPRFVRSSPIDSERADLGAQLAYFPDGGAFKTWVIFFPPDAPTLLSPPSLPDELAQLAPSPGTPHTYVHQLWANDVAIGGPAGTRAARADAWGHFWREVRHDAGPRQPHEIRRSLCWSTP